VSSGHTSFTITKPAKPLSQAVLFLPFLHVNFNVSFFSIPFLQGKHEYQVLLVLIITEIPFCAFTVGVTVQSSLI